MRNLVALALILLVVGGCTGSADTKNANFSEALVANLPDFYEDESVSVKMDKVSPWCDHMPIIDLNPNDKRQYLHFEFTIKNKTDQKMKISLSMVRVSLDEQKLGGKVSMDDLKVVEIDGEDVCEIFKASRLIGYVGKRKDFKVAIQASGLFPEDSHGKPIYLMLVFSTESEVIRVRSSGKVAKPS
jgi:hypothetical protein